MRVEVVHGWPVSRVLDIARRLRLNKLVEIAVWPDEWIFWVIPALLAGRRLAKQNRPDAIAVFMMPYSTGLVGIALSKLTGVPLILKLNDSPTCADMHFFPTRFHYRLSRALEDFYVRAADAIVYVSGTNLESVRERHPPHRARRFHLVRSAAEEMGPRATSPDAERFEIVYTGGMNGWWALIERRSQVGPLQRIYRRWTRLGRYELAALDVSTSSPAVIGEAILGAIAEHSGWSDRLHLTVLGNQFPSHVVARALSLTGVQDVVTVRDRVPHDQVADQVGRADLLFMTLPARLDGSRGGRISAKTYEYLMTDRPILAALPRGENWDYLADKPGVWLVDPHDRRAMKEVIVELTSAKFEGRALSFDRRQLRQQLSYQTRAAEFEEVVRAAIEHRLGAGSE